MLALDDTFKEIWAELRQPGAEAPAGSWKQGCLQQACFVLDGYEHHWGAPGGPDPAGGSDESGDEHFPAIVAGRNIGCGQEDPVPFAAIVFQLPAAEREGMVEDVHPEVFELIAESLPGMVVLQRRVLDPVRRSGEEAGVSAAAFFRVGAFELPEELWVVCSFADAVKGSGENE